MNKVEAAYVAGLMDGEGCFRLERFPTARSPIGFQYRTVVEIAMCDRNTIEYIASVTGRERIETRTIKSGRTVYKLVWRNSIAAGFIRELLPFLRGKKEQAQLCLHFEDNITPGRGRSYRPEDKALCDQVLFKLREMKKPIALSC